MADDFDSLLKDMAYAERAPDAAMRTATAHAAALAPRIAAIARRRIDSGWVYPPEDNLLFYGLFVLAAARERAIWPVWLELLRLPEADLRGLFGNGAVVSVAAVTLALVGQDTPAIVALIERPEASRDARAGLLNALTRLMCEGRHARADFIGMLDRLAAAEMGERVEWDIEEAILLGGVAERADLLERFWRTDAFVMRGAEKGHARARLRAAAADPRDFARFDERGIAAPADPSDPLRWFMPLDSAQDCDPPERAPLTWREREWFEGFLRRGRPAGADAMRFEELDGLFHAFALGPDVVLPSEGAVKIWGEDGPAFEDPLQARTIPRLLQRHWNAIAQRAAGEDLASPWLEPQRGHAAGQLWSRGFAAGVRVRQKAWDAMPADDAAAGVLADVLSLERSDLGAAERIEILRNLPGLVADIAGFWRGRG